MARYSMHVVHLLLVCFSLVVTAQSERPLSNTDVLQMINAGLGEAVIAQKINVSVVAFDLKTENLIELKKAGVSDGILQAMLSKQKAPASEASAVKEQRPDELFRLREYLNIPQDYTISRADTSRLAIRFPLRVYVYAGNDIHVVDTIKDFVFQWNLSWLPFDRQIEIVSRWQDADLIVSHYALTEELKRVSESRSEIRTENRVITGSSSDYGAVYAGIALRDPWLAIAGAIPKPVQAIIPEIKGQTVTESYDILPVITYFLTRTGPQHFELLGRHVYTAKNGKGLGQVLWPFLRDLVPTLGGIFINEKYQVIAQSPAAFPALEALSGMLFVPFVVYGGQSPVKRGPFTLAYGLKGLNIQDERGRVIYEGYGAMSEMTSFEREADDGSYFVVLTHQADTKLSKRSMSGYFSIPRPLRIQ